MKVVGIIGGIGSGKSSVSSIFVKKGAPILDADRAGHLTLQESYIKQKLLERFGTAIFEHSIEKKNNVNNQQQISEMGNDSAGIIEKNIDNYSINRKLLADLVFASTEEAKKNLAFLNALIHPEIARKLEKQRQTFEARKKEFVILDAPLILEAGWHKMADYLIFVEAEEETRWNRVRKRNWSRQEFKNREAAQMPLSEKKKFADFVINNNQPWDQMVEQVESLIKTIRQSN
ncbi:MAG: dephospho-CoA kinase [Planctomycetia bacterium]|nr:dephospho-CoA kinase [Planctomycetia bacterium]